MKKHRGIQIVALIACLTLSLFLLSACQNGGEMILTHENGAEVKVTVEQFGANVSVTDNVLSITKDGYIVIAQLVDRKFVEKVNSSFGNRAGYTMFEVNGRSSIGYINEANTEHLISIDDVTYLRLASVSQDFLFDVESRVTFEVVKQGQVEDFASHFSE